MHIHERSADTNLAGIHEEMSELLDKQMNVRKESLKKLPGFTQAPASPRIKCAMKMKERKERKKRLLRKKNCGDRKDIIRLYQKNG